MKIAVALSGGVDSTVAAALLRQQGHEIVGLTMTLGRQDEADSLAAAHEAAKLLGIELEVCDLAKEWNGKVLDYIRETYMAGKTPNPCVRCNETVKFGLLPRHAFEIMKCDRFATGHYARLEERNGRPVLKRGVDRQKDQSYFLYRVAPDVLRRTMFPLGEMLKDEVRAKARELGLKAADNPDSQDFCGGDTANIVNAAPKNGNIVTIDGKVLGTHNGFWNYTIGKRKGLGIGGGTPYYVVGLNAARNEVVVAFKENTIRYDIELVETVGVIDKTLPVKVRSAGEPRRLKDGISGIAPGQSAVFYDGDTIVGGGIIA